MYAVHNLITISKILIIKTTGPDVLMFYTDRPDAFLQNSCCMLRYDVPSGSGEKYCRENFNGVRIEVVKV